jgi:hypothetical protein
MSKKFHLVPAALLALLLGAFFILRARPVPTAAPPTTTDAAAPEKVAGPKAAKDVPPPAEAGPRVRGRVLTESREPIEDARIWIGNGWWNPSQPLGTTAKDGSYTLILPESDLPNYRQIHVMAEGYRPDTRKFGPIVGDRGPTILLQRSPTLRGVVLERGSWRRLGGVRVQLKLDVLDGDSLLEVQAREDGTFDIGSLPSGHFTLSARGLGYHAVTAVNEDGSAAVPADVPPAVAALYPGQAILALPPTGTALVSVKDEAGKPVSGAEVQNVEAVKTDAEGRARLVLPEGEDGVAVSADGYVSGHQKFQIVAHSETKVDVVLRKGGARIFGTISVAEGQPEPRSVELWPGVLGSEGAHCRQADVHSAVAAGRQYSIHVPHDEPIRLVVRFESERGEGRIPWFDRGSVTLAYGQALERNLVIEPLCRLVIAVKDPKGRPVAGASVHWEGGTLYQFERDKFSGTLSEGESIRFGETLGYRRKGRGVTDAAGILTAFVVKGEYSVQVTHGQFKPHKGEQRFPVGGDATRDVVMKPALRVSGRLVACDGKPADGWWVGIGRRGNEDMAKSDGDGAFTLDSVDPGPQTLQVCWPEYIQTELMTQAVDVTEGMAPLEIRLPPLPMLRARLRGFRVQDLGEARLDCGVSDQQVGWMTVRFSVPADEQGQFLLGPLPVATYGYSLKIQMNGVRRPYIAARGKVSVAPARETTLDFDCEAPGSVSVEIDIADTARYDRYALVLERPDGQYVDSADAEIAPGSAAKKTIELIAAPGKYLVEVVGSINYNEDRKRKVLRESVTLEASGKVALSATSK